ncbi:MAG TPA: hypothetical protein VHV77_15425 [Pirellulales bacterium]|jgi:hypothetical protein|nr:hypothetical protein [Pirellulales bacterium]
MSVNLFTWIRDGVRQAVLHGVSDAVGQIGSPGENDDMSKRLLEIIRSSDAPTVASSPPKSRKLGRSLEQIVHEKRS